MADYYLQYVPADWPADVNEPPEPEVFTDPYATLDEARTAAESWWARNAADGVEGRGQILIWKEDDSLLGTGPTFGIYDGRWRPARRQG